MRALRGRLRLSINLLLLTVHLPACSTYGVMADPAAELQAAPTPVTNALVVLRTGERFNLKTPQVDGDSLRGFSNHGVALSVPLANVAWLESRQPSPIRTASLVAGIVVTVTAVAVFVSTVVVVDDVITTCWGTCE